MRLGVLDAELAATLWLLLEARVPLFVAGTRPPGAIPRREFDRRGVLEALLDLLPPSERRIPMDGSGEGLDGLTSVDAATATLVGFDLTAVPAFGVRLAMRALSRGATMTASIEADSLEDVLLRLRSSDLRLSDDEITFIGVVIVVRTVDAGPAGDPRAVPRARVVAAHYVRPLARDPAGHVQRQPPAVLATWDPVTDEFEHFAWGISADLAGRTGLRPGDVDGELERRRLYLAGLLGADVMRADQLRSALAGYRLVDKPGPAV